MRVNKFVAGATGMSRRSADTVIAAGRVLTNGQPAQPGSDVAQLDTVTLDGKPLTMQATAITVLLNKPIGYVVSRQGQGSRTVYDLLPPELHICKPVGRLDKDSSGLLLMTTDGDLANQLTHPSRQKRKVYEVTLDQKLSPLHRQMIADHGLRLEDGLSKFELERQQDDDEYSWIVTMTEGRNRQIRRTFQALGYQVVKLRRTQFGDYSLHAIRPGKYEVI